MSARKNQAPRPQPSTEDSVVEVAKTVEPEPKRFCDNHPDAEAVLVTDGTKFQVLRLCANCVPSKWR